jgi:hypothetical protein
MPNAIWYQLRSKIFVEVLLLVVGGSERNLPEATTQLDCCCLLPRQTFISAGNYVEKKPQIYVGQYSNILGLSFFYVVPNLS